MEIKEIDNKLKAQIKMAEEMQEIRKTLELMHDTQRTFLREIIQAIDREKKHECDCKEEKPKNKKEVYLTKENIKPFKFKDLTA